MGSQGLSDGILSAPRVLSFGCRRRVPSWPLLARLFFASGLSGLKLGVVLSQEQLAQHLQIATEDTQAYIALVAEFALVATAFLAIAGLQGADGRLNPGMTLACLTK